MSCSDGDNPSAVEQNSGSEAVTASNQDLRDTQEPQNAMQELANEQGVQNMPDNIPLANAYTAANAPVNRPSEPLGFKGVVYTDTEIELFWDRSTDPSVISYHITRNGSNVTTIDALSYYDNTVQPGTTYEYTEQSVDADRVRSISVSQFLTTPETMPTINLTNAKSILDHVITVTSGIMFRKEISRVEALANAHLLDFTVLAFEPDDYMNREYNCDVNSRVTTVSDGFVLPSLDIAVDNCASLLFDEETMNGDWLLRPVKPIGV